MAAKILVVDDDIDVTSIIVELLSGYSYEVQVAENASVAIEMLRSFSPDLIITDVMMPKMDGWEFCQTIKANPKLKDIPILIITAKTDQIAELRSFESGADDYLSKPFDNHEMLDTIKRLIEKKGSKFEN